MGERCPRYPGADYISSHRVKSISLARRGRTYGSKVCSLVPLLLTHRYQPTFQYYLSALSLHKGENVQGCSSGTAAKTPARTSRQYRTWSHPWDLASHANRESIVSCPFVTEWSDLPPYPFGRHQQLQLISP
jgi:hypothetical protein